MTGDGRDLFSMEFNELVEYLSSLDGTTFNMLDDFSTKLVEAVNEVKVQRSM